MVEKLNATEEEILLVPASYNKRGLHGDFKVAIKGVGVLRPYTSVREYFKYFEDAKYVYAYLEPVRGSPLYYKITREDCENNLEGLEALVEKPDILGI